MKLIMSLIISLVGVSAFAASSGKTLQQAVVKMGQCTGVKNAEGKEFLFNPGGVAIVRTYATDDGGAYANEYSNEYSNEYGNEYDNEYGNEYDNAYSVDSSSVSSVKVAWYVRGQEVLIQQGKTTYSLIIGFKSKTCWIK